MAPPANTKYALTPIDHLRARIHFPKLLYFATQEENPKVIIDTFLVGLQKTLDALSIYAGTIGNDESAKKPGTMVVQQPYRSAEDLLQTVDLRSEYDFDVLDSKGFPPDGVDLSLVWPQSHDNPVPVLKTQLSLIRNGAILYIGLHHCVVDEVGMVNFLRVWSTYCRGEDGAALMKKTWFNQELLQAGAGSGNPKDHPEYTFAEEPQPLIDHKSFFVPSPTVQCDILFFSDVSLKRLKHMVEQSVKAYVPNPPDYVSTSDALFAFLWSGISAARLSVEPKPPGDLTSKLRLAINLRPKLNPRLAEDYCGNASKQVDAVATLSSIACLKAEPNEQIAIAALAIRAAYNAITNDTVRDIIQMVHNLPDLGHTKALAVESQHSSLQSTTWQSQPYYDMDWGAALGHQIRRFRGRNLETDGLTAVFPRIPSSHPGGGGIEFLFALERTHLDWLRQNEAFSEFVQWRCVIGGDLRGERAPVQMQEGIGNLEGMNGSKD